MKLLFFVVVLLLLCGVDGYSQSKLDSIQSLLQIDVVANRYDELMPAQRLRGDDLAALNSFSVADAIRYFSGVQLKDYGGIGGLKTIDIRSMGTNHMGVFYDGIQLGNAQNGQIDLGKFSLDNMEEIALYNGQKSEIFQSAKDFGSSGSIYLRTRIPRFSGQKSNNLKAVLRTGSFDLVNSSFLWEHKFSEVLSSSFNAELISASGHYPFRYRRVLSDGTVAYDTTAIRQNGDVQALRVEIGVNGRLDHGRWNTKLYFYDSERGIPGAIVNNVWKRAQRQWDRNLFVQGSWLNSLMPNYDILLNAKYAVDYMRYLNPDTTLLFIDNRFYQQEAYVSIANKVQLLRNWDVNLSVDLQYNTLRSTMAGFVVPHRFTSLAALASALNLYWLKVQGSVLASFVNDVVVASDGGRPVIPDKKELSPAMYVSVQPFKEQELYLRAFYKQVFRMPTFNDLYYTDIGNVALKPEYTHQYNVGLEYSTTFSTDFIESWHWKTDAYYNEVTDKIIAVPKGNGMYRWMMLNLGLVKIKGVDVSTHTLIALMPQLKLSVKANYTYQQARDFTLRRNEDLMRVTYGGLIPYIPIHSGSLIGGLHFGHWRVNYSFIYVGERFHTSANIRENYEQPWYTHDLSVSRQLKWNKWSAMVALEVNNLLGQNYEVVLNYPMPLRNYKLIVSVEL